MCVRVSRPTATANPATVHVAMSSPTPATVTVKCIPGAGMSQADSRTVTVQGSTRVDVPLQRSAPGTGGGIHNLDVHIEQSGCATQRFTVSVPSN